MRVHRQRETESEIDGRAPARDRHRARHQSRERERARVVDFHRDAPAIGRERAHDSLERAARGAHARDADVTADAGAADVSAARVCALARRPRIQTRARDAEARPSPHRATRRREREMGIKGLTALLSENAPGAMREQKFDSYLDRRVAVDASMHIYQFLIAIGRTGESTLTNEAGEVTSHLQGMLTRTARMLEAGIKPVYVFDGKPPQMKGGELAKRKDKREEAEAALKAAREAGDQEEIERQSKRTVRVSKEQSQEVMKLATLLGIPVFEAPCEAEASCAALCKAGLVWAVATEDMDTLTFAAPRVARNLMAPKSAEKPVLEFDYEKVLAGLELTADQFIDLCILCGCDYCDTIRGIGPKTALKLIKEHGSIENILEAIDTEKYAPPKDWEFAGARDLFKNPEVMDINGIKLAWKAPDEEGLVEFLVKEKSFQEERVRSVCAKIRKARQGAASQNRLESFFGPPKIISSTIGKRKVEETKGKNGKAGLANKKSKGVSGYKSGKSSIA